MNALEAEDDSRRTAATERKLRNQMQREASKPLGDTTRVLQIVLRAETGRDQDT